MRQGDIVPFIALAAGDFYEFLDHLGETHCRGDDEDNGVNLLGRESWVPCHRDEPVKYIGRFTDYAWRGEP